MISAWHLLWIVPLSAMLGIFTFALVSINEFNKAGSEVLNFGEPLEDYYVDGSLNLRKCEDDGKQDT